MSKSVEKTPKWVWKQVAMKKKRAKILEGMLCSDNKWGAFVIIKYHNVNNVLVRMIGEDKPVMVGLGMVLNKTVKSKYTETVYGKGYIGEGRYKTRTCSAAYNLWKLHVRKNLPEKYHNFQVFAKEYYNGGVILERGD